VDTAYPFRMSDMIGSSMLQLHVRLLTGVLPQRLRSGSGAAIDDPRPGAGVHSKGMPL
jgi:hypothetical protein